MRHDQFLLDRIMSQKGARTPSIAGSREPFVTKACDMCRKKKIRCEPTEQSCLQCIKFKTLCHFTPISVKRKPRRLPGQKRLEELEERLRKAEDKLKRASETQPKTIDGASDEMQLYTELLPAQKKMNHFFQSWDEVQSNLRAQSPFDSRTRDLMYDMLNGVQTTGIGMTSPAILLLSPKDWPKLSDHQLTHIKSTFSRHIIKPLPPKPQALFLIQRAFLGLQCPFSIFNQRTFLQRFESEESPYEDPAWWACINVVLALAHRFRAMVCLNSTEEDREAWGYFQNALAVTTELTMLNHTLTAVQALVGMAIVVQGSPNPGPYASLTASAMRLAQTLNLHRSQEGSGLPRELVEERKRVFWVAYILDRDVSLRTRRPPTQDDDEMDVELPLEDSTVPGLNFMNDRVRLALIQGQIYKRLLSLSASRQSFPQRVTAIRDLEAKLQAWRASVPIDFQREYFYESQDAPLPEQEAGTVILRVVYFDTLNAIHSSAPSIQQHDGAGLQDERLPPPITFVTEARKAIKLLHVTPQGDYACIWIVLHIFVSATKTLLHHLIREPGDPLAESDLELIDPLLRLLGMLANGERSEEVSRMYAECVELFEKAKVSVEDSANRIAQWTDGAQGAGGPPTEKESVEDFIRRIESISAGIDDVPVTPNPALHSSWDTSIQLS
ncbi:uncharacterized protein PAC_14936 [Phialocephala subalpina]|uniref:Zn(2)-C6 fungal-type domain-containing protein n=1 Tax=Phialocephala subalpina TaxID=576137 RepID=A0A1L7XJC1_9HELO|nr:uncharacterized protein PAC_14936 [Phialocephala subalpina]